MAFKDGAEQQAQVVGNGSGSVRQVNPAFSGRTYIEPARTPSELWLKTGYVDEAGRFIGLPLDQPLDNMREGDAGRSQSPAFVALIAAQNEFLKKCLEIGADLAPGEEVEIGGLVVRIRRANKQVAAAPVEQPVNLSERLTLTKIVRPVASSN